MKKMTSWVDFALVGVFAFGVASMATGMAMTVRAQTAAPESLLEDPAYQQTVASATNLSARFQTTGYISLEATQGQGSGGQTPPEEPEASEPPVQSQDQSKAFGSNSNTRVGLPPESVPDFGPKDPPADPPTVFGDEFPDPIDTDKVTTAHAAQSPLGQFLRWVYEHWIIILTIWAISLIGVSLLGDFFFQIKPNELSGVEIGAHDIGVADCLADEPTKPLGFEL